MLVREAHIQREIKMWEFHKCVLRLFKFASTIKFIWIPHNCIILHNILKK